MVGVEIHVRSDYFGYDISDVASKNEWKSVKLQVHVTGLGSVNTALPSVIKPAVCLFADILLSMWQQHIRLRRMRRL